MIVNTVVWLLSIFLSLVGVTGVDSVELTNDPLLPVNQFTVDNIESHVSIVYDAPENVRIWSLYNTGESLVVCRQIRDDSINSPIFHTQEYGCFSLSTFGRVDW